jgi:pimeloyl-ACP methyl ester carboxylesterase
MSSQGFVALLLDAPFAKPFAPKRDMVAEALPLYREGIIDMLRGVDLLKAMSEVDSTRLFVVGHSYGAHLGGVLAGLRPSLVRGCVLMAGSAAITRSTELSRQPYWTKLRQRKPKVFRQFVLNQEPLDARHYLADAQAPVLLQYGLQDEYEMNEPEARQYAALWPTGRSEVRWYTAKHQMESEQARQDRIKWLLQLAASN